MQFESLQLKRGNEAQVASYVGPSGELVVDTQNWNLHAQDGVNPGGTAMGGNIFAISAPEVLSPVSGATGVPASPTIQTSGFAGDGIHTASRFQLASDSAFTNIIHDSQRTTSNLTSYSLEGAGVTLEYGATVYVRVWHESDEAGASDWSAAVSFAVLAVEPGAVIDGDIVIGQHNGEWILVAPATKRATRKWGLYRTDTSLPNNPGTDPNASSYNTDVLTSSVYSNINDGSGSIGSPAAEYCRSMGYDLPNKDVLYLIYQNRAEIDAADISGGENTLASLAKEYAWSSTEHSSGLARMQALGMGTMEHYNKRYDFWVIPVRSIPI